MKCVALLLLAAASPVFAAGGFTTADLDAAALRATDARLVQARELAAATDTLRAAFVLNPDTAWTAMTADERAAVQGAFGNDVGARREELSWLMRSARVRVGTGEARDVSGLYSPVAQAWLLLRWARVGGQWRVTGAALIPARRLAAATDWTERSEAPAAALALAAREADEDFASVTQYQAAPAIFEQLAATRAEDRDAVMTSCTKWVASIAGWRQNPARFATWRGLHGELAEARGVPAAIARLPQPVRASLTPAASVATTTGTQLLIVSPLFPGLVVAADFPEGNPTPTMALIDLDAPERPALSQGERR